jgi:D-3-phosphoglycerate dehydrogenase
LSKPVVLVAEELSPAGIAVLESDFEVRHVDGADRGLLLPAVADVDALIVRSATKVNAEVFAAARKLRVVARAGVGLDNVDVEAATKAGVMVVNAPTSNIVTAAEHAIALLLATARNVPQGHAALKQGEWKRSKYTGVELAGKTVGVLGLGRIGVLVAQRLAAFDMNVVAYDPYVQAARAAQLGVKLVTLDELLRESDFITVHLPKTPETLGLIGDRELHQVKPSVRIVNAARGGIVDEAALDLAIKDGRSRARSSWRCRASSCRTPSTSRAAPSPRTSSPACRSPRSSAASSPRSPGASRSGWTSWCAARSPRTTSRCWSWPR